MRRALGNDLNFASRDYALSERLVLILAVVSALLVLTAGLMAAEIVASRTVRASLDRQRAELEARSKKLLPALEERDRLSSDLAAMNELVESRKFSWTLLLTETERVFPEGAALERFVYDPRERSLLLEGTARTPEALRNLMASLERSAAFRNPQLKHQTVDKEGISFQVGAHYQ